MTRYRIPILLSCLIPLRIAHADVVSSYPPEVETHPELENMDEEVVRAFYYIASSRPEYAIEYAVRILQIDPSFISVHRAYIYGLLELRQSELVISLYEEWLAEEPTDPIRRIALAWALMARRDQAGEWCDEVDRLTRVEPTNDPVDSLTYWTMRARYEASVDCFIDSDDSRRALIDIGSEVEEAWGYRLRLILNSADPIDLESSAEIISYVNAYPNRLAYIGNLWAPHLEGSALETTREAVVELAREHASSSDAVVLFEAARVLGMAGLPEEEAQALALLARVDPGNSPRDIMETDIERSFLNSPPSHRPTENEIRVAELVAAHQGRELLRALRTIDGEIPPMGAARSDWHTARATVEHQLGRTRESLESLRLAWASLPPDSVNKGVAANAYAWRAAELGMDLDNALEAIEEALDNLPRWDPTDPDYSSGSYEAWLFRQRQTVSAWLDTHGWILYRLGRTEEAVNLIQEAILMRPRPHGEITLHLGLAHARLGNTDMAITILSRGLSLSDPNLPISIEARTLLDEMLVNHRWPTDDVESWIRAHQPVLPPTTTTESREDYRVGHRFPDLVFSWTGEEKRISDFEGVRVVHLWASWDQSSMDSLSNLQRIAVDYESRGVHIISLSIDQNMSAARRYLQRITHPGLELGWLGTEGANRAHTREIPAVFVLDADMTILEYGANPNDEGEWLVAQLEEILDVSESSGTESENQ